MAPALRLNVNGRRNVVPLDEVAVLARGVRRLPADAYPSAVNAATILEAASAEQTASDVEFEPGEEQALGRVLHGLDVERRLPDALRAVWNDLRAGEPASRRDDVDPTRASRR